MADVLEPAASGRASCRGCGRAIPKGELRFGESLPNPYAEGEALHWFHLVCAACMRPEKLGPALDAHAGEVPDREWLRRSAEFGAAHRRVPRISRVERASSGRAACRQCRERIDKGAFRIALQMFEEGRMNPIGTIHLACAEPYFGTRDIMDRLVRLTPDLGAEDAGEIERQLREAPRAPTPAEEGTQGVEPGDASPGIAKVREADPADAARKRDASS